MAAKRGRPPAIEGGTRQATLSTKFSEGEVALADELAARLGITRAELLRRSLHAVAARPELVASPANPKLTIVREYEGHATVAFISRYPTEQDLAEALGPPRSEPVSQPPTATTFPRFIHEFVDEHPAGFPRKIVSLVATAQGTLTLKASLETAAGDRFTQSHKLVHCDALDISTALSEWLASPDSVLRENSDGTPAPAPAIDFGPKNAAEARVFAEECFRVDVQITLHGLMLDRGVSASDMATRMGVSEAHVAAFFADEANVTIRDLARFYHALGLPPPVLGKRIT